MKRTLSSGLTPLHKIILPVCWLTGWSVGTLLMFVSAPEDPDEIGGIKWVFLAMLFLGAALMYWFGIRLQAVSVDDEYLYVSNYLKEVAIPLTAIDRVTENRWVNIHPVTIHLKSPSGFGDQITFMPKTRWFGFFSSHPVVDELLDLVERRSGVPAPPK